MEKCTCALSGERKLFFSLKRQEQRTEFSADCCFSTSVRREASSPPPTAGHTLTVLKKKTKTANNSIRNIVHNHKKQNIVMTNSIQNFCSLKHRGFEPGTSSIGLAGESRQAPSEGRRCDALSLPVAQACEHETYVRPRCFAHVWLQQGRPRQT